MSSVNYIDWARNTLHLEWNSLLQVENIGGGQNDDKTALLNTVERGVYGTATLSKGSRLASLPISSLLTIQYTRDVPVMAKLLQQHPTLHEDIVLSLLLLLEKSLNERSKWYQHITLLPAKYHNIINYEKMELKWIQGSNLYTIASQWQAQTQEDYQQIYHILSNDPTGYQDILSILSYESFVWAFSSICSRFISIEVAPGQIMKAMVPVVDMLNHHPESKVNHRINQFQQAFELYIDEDFVIDNTMREIFLNYGALPNSRLLMLYGFTLPNNQYDKVDIYVSLNEALDPNYKLKASLLKKCGVEDFTKPFEVKHNTIPELLLIFLRVQHINFAEKENIVTVLNKIKGGYDLGLDELALIGLKDALMGMIRQYPHKIEYYRSEIDKEQVKEFNDPSGRYHHAMTLVHSELLILHTVLDKVKTMLK